MRSLAWLSAVALCLAVAPTAFGRDTVKPAETCGDHGTSIDFFDTPSEAARAALKQEKLVFVLHVSGNFEDPRFT
ncbi:MAG: hypothetical protein JNM56_22640 [Planctomycetia bacterium]|nr:hypothetical protein [Planctomycetia bacterium]